MIKLNQIQCCWWGQDSKKQKVNYYKIKKIKWSKNKKYIKNRSKPDPDYLIQKLNSIYSTMVSERQLNTKKNILGHDTALIGSRVFRNQNVKSRVINCNNIDYIVDLEV